MLNLLASLIVNIPTSPIPLPTFTLALNACDGFPTKEDAIQNAKSN